MLAVVAQPAPGRGEVIFQVRAADVRRTDLLLIHNLRQELARPVALGHEIVGEAVSGRPYCPLEDETATPGSATRPSTRKKDHRGRKPRSETLPTFPRGHGRVGRSARHGSWLGTVRQVRDS